MEGKERMIERRQEKKEVRTAGRERYKGMNE